MSLAVCLDKYADEGVVEDFRCEGCQKTGSVETVNCIKEGPQTLILHILRTNYDGSKVSTPVTFPTGVLDLKPWSSNPEGGEDLRYEVFGVVEHQGKS